MKCGDAWSVGSLRKAGAWAGRCGWGWSAVLVVHERLCQTGFVSRQKQPNPSRDHPATRHFTRVCPSLLFYYPVLVP